MRYSILFIAVCITSLTCFCQTVKKYSDNEVAALNEVAGKWQKYWNNHDMEAFGALFAGDIDFVTPIALLLSI